MIIVLITVPKEKSEEIAKYILEKRLGACVNIVDCKSLYWWKGKIEDSEESIHVLYNIYIPFFENPNYEKRIDVFTRFKICFFSQRKIFFW